MNRIDRILTGLSRLAEAIGALAIITMMLHISTDVFLKYFFNHPLPGTLELVATYYMVAILFLPLGLVTRKESHVSVELFSLLLPTSAREMVIGSAFLISSAYCALLAWRGTVAAIRATRLYEIWEAGITHIYVWPTRWFFPIGCGLAALMFALLAFDHFAKGRNGRAVLRSSESLL